ncbi:MAG: hypothetical protein AAF196_03050 [Planctomycetota bacterium]
MSKRDSELRICGACHWVRVRDDGKRLCVLGPQRRIVPKHVKTTDSCEHWQLKRQSEEGRR